MRLHTKGHQAISNFNKALNYKEHSKLSQQDAVPLGMWWKDLI